MTFPHSQRPLWIIVFDAAIGGFFGLIVGQSAGGSPDPASEYYTPAAQRTLHWAAVGLDMAVAAGALAAALCLWRGGRWSPLLQRTIFYALLARTAYVFLELSLPSEGGIGGFLLLLEIPFLLVLTGIALAAAWRAKRAESG